MLVTNGAYPNLRKIVDEETRKQALEAITGIGRFEYTTEEYYPL